MDTQEVKNLEIIKNMVKNRWGLSDDSFNFFSENIFNPKIQPEFSNYKFDENFRCYIDLDMANEKLRNTLGQSDKGWTYFCCFFQRAINNLNIKYENYSTNKIKIEKNEVKLKKVLEDFYKKDNSLFLYDVLDIRNNISSSTIVEIFGSEFVSNFRNINYLKDKIEYYIVKAFEFIGRYKASSKKMKMVISYNFADWFLCSTKEKWSSCLNLEGSGYWRGIVNTIGDRSRVLLYITDGSKKKYYDITTDSFMYRTWIFLSEDNKKVISKFYPTAPFSPNTINELTNDKTYVDSISSSVKCKYPVYPIVFNKDHCFISVYNDRIKYQFPDGLKDFYYRFERGNYQTYNFKSKRESDMNIHSIHGSLSNFIEHEDNICSEFRSQFCTTCNTKDDKLFETDTESLCKKCITGDYYYCEYCQTYHKHSVSPKIKFKELFVCSDKQKHIVKCEICGEVEIDRDLRSFRRKKDKKIINMCKNCQKSKVVVCAITSEKILKEEAFRYKDKYYSEEALNNISMKEELKGKQKCSICNTFFDEHIPEGNFGESYCEACLQIERDKLQKFFEF